LRLHIMRTALAAEAQDSKLVQEFVCTTPRCGGRKYTDLYAAQIINPETGEFHCEECNQPLAQDVGQGEAGDGTERRRRKDEARALLSRLDDQLRPLEEALARARSSGADPPDYGSLEEWVSGRRAAALLEEKRARIAEARGAGGGAGGAKRGRGFDYLEDTEFDVQLEGEEVPTTAQQAPAALPPPAKRARMVANPPWLVRKTGAAAAAPPTAGSHAAEAEEEEAYRREYIRQFQEQLASMAAAQAAGAPAAPAGVAGVAGMAAVAAGEAAALPADAEDDEVWEDAD
jgi:hypothetical protein